MESDIELSFVSSEGEVSIKTLHVLVVLQEGIFDLLKRNGVVHQGYGVLEPLSVRVDALHFVGHIVPHAVSIVEGHESL